MTVAAPEKPASTQQRIHQPWFRWLIVALVLIVAIVAAVAVKLTLNWPFTQAAMIQSLQQQSGSEVKFGKFQQTFFLSPGCIAEEVTFAPQGQQTAAPAMRIARLTVRTSYAGLLLHHIDLVRAEGMHVNVPPTAEPGSALAPSSVSLNRQNSNVGIGQIVADGAVVELAPKSKDGQPLVFAIPRLSVTNVKDDRPLTFRAQVRNPEPPGDLQVAGQFGPWKSGNAGQTPLSGSYHFANAELGVFPGIGGTLSSEGKFNGVLQSLKVAGNTHVPDFEVDKAGHPIDLTVDFNSLVDGTKGKVALTDTRAQFGKTTILSSGVVARKVPRGKGRETAVSLVCPRGRVQDLLRMFVSEDPPPMTGAIAFKAQAVIPPGSAPFLKKLRLDGDFGIDKGQYSNPDTQRKVEVLSAKARGQADKIEDDQEADRRNGTDKTDQDLERVVSDVKGHVELRDGVAHFTKLSFNVPGASALLDGTYDLISKQINMHGTVLLDTKLSKATTGVKSFLLKIVQPFQGNQKNGAVVLLHVTGTYGHPQFQVIPGKGK